MNRSNFGAVRLPLLGAAVLASFAVSLSAQVVEKGRTYADLVATHPCNSGSSGRLARITDAQSSSSIGGGGGSTQVWAVCNGVDTWTLTAIGGGGGGGGVTGLTSCADGTAIADNAILRGDGTTKCQGSPVTVADTTGTITMPSGADITTSGGATIAFDEGGAGRHGFATTPGGAINFYIDPANGRLAVLDGLEFGWSANLLALGNNTGVKRFADGVLKVTDGGSGVRGLVGGGTAIASATALPVPTGGVQHITGTTTVTSITSTNFQAGACVVLIFDDALTFTDGNNLKLAGNFVTTADDTLSLCYDGTNWHETARSVN